MTRTATVSPEIDQWRQHARMVRDVTGINMRGLTHEESLVQPQPGGNCLNWVLGHLLAIYDGFLPLLGQEPVLGTAALQHYARGAAPITDPSEAIAFEKLVTAWSQANERVDAGLAGLAPESLDQPAKSPTGNPNETVRTLVTTVMFHQAYHTGQTALLRRLTGHEGAIK